MGLDLNLIDTIYPDGQPARFRSELPERPASGIPTWERNAGLVTFRGKTQPTVRIQMYQRSCLHLPKEAESNADWGLRNELVGDNDIYGYCANPAN